MDKVDTNLYSRQIKTFGIETMGKLQNLKALIVGMRGLGVEIAKNIILSGIKEVKILDKNKTLKQDLGSNFFLSEDNIGKPRDISSLPKLKELNPYVNVDIFRGNLEENIDIFDVIIITEIMNTKFLFSVNEKCHDKKVHFIYCLNLGLSCFIFTDFGNNHIITDPLGKEKKIYFIQNIDKSGIITIDQRNGENFSLSSGNFVKFREVEGIDELNDGNPRKIKYISKKAFSLEDKYSYDNFKAGGIVEEVILPKEKKYKLLKESFYIPYSENQPEINDYSKEGRNELLHCALIAIHKYYDEKNDLPEINNQDHAKEVLNYAKSIFENAKNNNEEWIKNIEQFEDQIIINVARWSKCEISPICSFLGGIASQELVKITGKYIPIEQWLWFDFFESIEDLKKDIDRDLADSRYDDQIAIFGNDIQKKLNCLNIFIIGAGALGCEFLKNFAMMGISTGKDANTIITDNDLIEISNLNRQFLFHKKDVRKSKSKIAVKNVKLMNKEFNCKSLELFVNEDTEDYFNEEFWKKQNFIFTAVDSVNARKFIDNQCTKYTKTLIDTGTLGTGGSCNVFVPFKTSSYQDIKIMPELSIPLCTLRNFPSKIEHCIEWSLSKFKEFFTIPVEELNKFLNNKEGYYTLIQNEETTSVQINKLKEIKNLLQLIEEKNLEKILKQAINSYNNNYDYNIKMLLNEFPSDSKNEDGSLFWSGSKRIPNPIKFNINNENCFNFIKYYSILLGRSINIEIKNDENYIRKIIEKIDLPSEFISSTQKNPSKEEEMNEIQSLKDYLNNYDMTKIKNIKMIPERFEKDNDSNNHVFFVNLCANLRAENYRIPKTDEQKTKMIAGRIVPAIASTTATVTGFACMQLLSLIISEDISLIKNCNFNTAYNLYQINNPSDLIHMKDEEYNIIFDGPTKAVPPGWTSWDIINLKGPMTCQNFVDFFQKEYGVKILSISSNSKNIISMFMPSKIKKINLKIEEVYENNYGLKKDQSYLWLEITGKKDNIHAIMPKIKYNFK
jgi:ubiquitin-activating enzyme E1